MEKGIFVAKSDSPEEISELTKSILNGLSINNETMKTISDNVLSLEFSKQLFVINDIINNMYCLSICPEDEYLLIEKFLAQRIFSTQRQVLTDIFFKMDRNGLTHEERIESHEKKYNIKIDLSLIQ